MGQSTDRQLLAYAVVLHAFNPIAVIVVGLAVLHGRSRRDPADDAVVSGR